MLTVTYMLPCPVPHPFRDAVDLPRPAPGHPVAKPDDLHGVRVIGICRILGFRSLLSNSGAQHLLRFTAVTVNGDSLAPQGVGGTVGFRHVFHGGVVGEIDGLGHRVVRVFLERRLHPHVPPGIDVVGHPEHVLDPFRHVQVLQGPDAGQPFHEFGSVEPLVASHRFQEGIAFHQARVVHHVPHVGQRKQRLNPAGGPGDDADRSRGRDGHRRRVAHGRGNPGRRCMRCFPTQGTGPGIPSARSMRGRSLPG